jgi:hypothetical protein
MSEDAVLGQVFVKQSWRSFRGWHKIVPLFFAIVGLFNKQQQLDFYERYLNVVGSTIYLTKTSWERLFGERAAPMPLTRAMAAQDAGLLHELVHIKQAEREGSWRFKWNYLMTPRLRYAYELEAYMITTFFWVRRFYDPDDSAKVTSLADQIARSVHAPIYRMHWRSRLTPEQQFEETVLTLRRFELTLKAAIQERLNTGKLTEHELKQLAPTSLRELEDILGLKRHLAWKQPLGPLEVIWLDSVVTQYLRELNRLPA